MKKTILVVTAFSCINLGMYAQTASPVSSQTVQIELLAEVTNVNGEEETLEVEAKKIPQTKAEMRQMKKEQRKKKKGFKDMSLGAKIGIAAAAVGIVVFFILTGGEGVSSR